MYRPATHPIHFAADSPDKIIAALRGRYFSFLGTCRGEAPPSCCARPFRCLKAPLGLSLLRYACKRKPYLENFMSLPNMIPAFQSTPLHKQWQELRSEQTVAPLHEQHHLYLFFASYQFRNICRKLILSAAVEGKNRPVATNFQFLKIFCPSGTSLLKLLRVFQVILLGRACPKPCHERVRQTGNCLL